MTKKLISVIIVNWNGLVYLEPCLNSLAKAKVPGHGLEIVLVDNASNDSSVSFIKKNYPKVKLVKNNKNEGFAEANNIGFHASKGEYVLFLNNDTKVTPAFLKELLKVVESDPNIAGAQSRIRLMDEPTLLDSVGAFLTRSGFLYHYGIAKKDSPKYQKQIKVFSAKGACMFFKRHVLEKILVDNELFDSSYFAYFEETDLCHRVWLAGYSIVFAPNSIIYHKMGGTSALMKNSYIQFHSFKNRINSYLKNLSFHTLVLILPVHFILCELYGLYTLLALKGNTSIFVTIQKAIWWNISHLSLTMRKRNYIKTQIQKRPDSDIEKDIFKKPRLSYYYHFLTSLRQYED
jgi:GT2 family glycosyltransferase